MMLSPEIYYEELKGKTPEEILKEIRSLRLEISSLKDRLDNQETSPEDYVMPDDRMRLETNRRYLEAAIRAYEEAGGEYVPTAEEQKARDFDASLPHISRIVFGIGGLFGGYETRTFTVSGNDVLLQIEHSFSGEPEPVFFPLTKDDLIDSLRELHIDEWKTEYSAFVLDGTQWELQIEYDDGRSPVRISGSNAYPYNFDFLKLLLGIMD